MKKFLFFIYLFGAKSIFAWEANFGSSTNPMTPKQYSIIRTNSNDGNIVLGNYMDNSVSPVKMKINVMKINDNGTVLWNKKIDMPNLRLLGTCVTNFSETQYALTGVIESGTPGNTNYSMFPIVVVFDESGTIVLQKKLSKRGIGLTIRKNGSNILIGGYYANSLEDMAAVRQGFLCKLDMNLNIVWNYSFNGQVSAGYWNFDHVETIVPITFANLSYYYITGGITKDVSIPGGIIKKPMILSQLIDDNGMRVWDRSNNVDMTGATATYNSVTNEILLVANGTNGNLYVSNYFRISFGSGTWLQFTTFEGDVSASPHGTHITYVHKMNILNNGTVKIYGFVRDYLYNGTFYPNKYIPFEITTNPNFTTASINLYMNTTVGYAIGGAITGNMPVNNFMPFLTSDVVCDYIKNGTNTFVSVSYDRPNPASDFHVHVYDASTQADDCKRKRSSAIVYANGTVLPLEINPNGFNDAVGVINLSLTNNSVTFIKTCYEWLDNIMYPQGIEQLAGTNSFRENNVKMVYNDITNTLSLSGFKYSNDVLKIHLFNSAGMEVVTNLNYKENQLIDLSKIASGIYFITITQNNQKQTLKLIKN